MNKHNNIDFQWDLMNPKGYNNRMGFYKTVIEMAFIEDLLIRNEIVKILDLGGGSGRFALPLSKKGYDISVIDLNKNAIDLCKERGIEKSYCLNIRDYNEIGFDLVLAIELFLVTPPLEVIQVANRSLKRNGLFITVGTNKKSWRYKLHSLRKKKSKNYGELSLDEYKNLFNKNGFEILKIEGFNWMPFRVNSNNFLVPFIAKLEFMLKLNKWLNQSPWLLFALVKKENCYSENSNRHRSPGTRASI